MTLNKELLGNYPTELKAALLRVLWSGKRRGSLTQLLDFEIDNDDIVWVYWRNHTARRLGKDTEVVDFLSQQIGEVL